MEDLLFHAAQANSADALRFLVVGLGADLNRLYTNPKRTCSFTLLHFCCDGGLVTSAKSLIRLGANKDILDSNGKNAMVCCWTLGGEEGLFIYLFIYWVGGSGLKKEEL